jgi:hypothetical protein
MNRWAHLGLCRSVLIGTVGLFCLACSPPDKEASGDSTSEIRIGGHVSNVELARLIARAPEPLTMPYGNQLLHATIAPTVTTARLKMLNEFVAAGLDRYRPTSNGQPDPRQEPYELLAEQIQVVYCVAPRDVELTSQRPGGQTLDTSVDIDAWGAAGPVKVEVNGVASADYELAFTMANHRVKMARVPAGSTAETTAKRMADAIQADKDAILHDFFDEHGIGPQTGESGGSEING